jgi:hypothetical protein
VLAERANQYLVIVSPSFTEQLRVGPAVPRFPSNIHGIERSWMGSLFGADSQPPVFRFWGSAPFRDGLAG